MKKIAGIATTLAIATAFCGFCTGIASSVNAEAETTPTVSTSAVGTAPKVILSPGRSYNSSVTYSIDSAAGDKVTKLTSAQEGEYFVENAWFANYSAGENLPNATTTRTDVQFAGWRYAVDGETKIVKTMPTVTDDLYLYAHWTTGDVGSNPEVPDNPDNPDNPDKPVTGNNSGLTYGPATGATSSAGTGGYIVGEIKEKNMTWASGGWDNGFLMTFDSGDYTNNITVYLQQGDVVKVRCNYSSKSIGVGYDKIKNAPSQIADDGTSDHNIVIKTSGYYTFKQYWANNADGNDAYMLVTYSATK